VLIEEDAKDVLSMYEYVKWRSQQSAQALQMERKNSKVL
jgi:hypothetical protein